MMKLGKKDVSLTSNQIEGVHSGNKIVFVDYEIYSKIDI